MPTTLIHAADLHIRNPSTAKRPDIRDDAIESWRQIVDLATTLSADAILLSGDIFHSRFPADHEVKAFVDHLRRVPATCTVFIICGNHDPSKVGGWTSIAGLSNVINPTGATEPFVIGNARIWGFDYVGREELYAKFLTAPKSSNIILLHQQPEEAGGGLIPSEFSLQDLPADSDGPRYWAAGNYHVPFMWRTDDQRPQQVFCFPGSTWSVSINEPVDKYVNVISISDDKQLTVNSHPLKTRRILRAVVKNQSDLETLLSQTLPKFKELCASYFPETSPTFKSIVDVTHVSLPDLVQKIKTVCTVDWCHLLLTPVDWSSEVGNLELDISMSLEDLGKPQPPNVGKLIKQVMGDRFDADVAGLVSDLWNAQDPALILDQYTQNRANEAKNV